MRTRVNSKWWVQLVTTFSSYHQPRGQTEKSFSWLYQCFLYFSLLVFPHQYNNLSLPYVFQVSTSASPNLTSMITYVWLFHRLWVDTPPRVFGTLHQWHSSSSDLLWPKYFKVSLCTQLGDKSCLSRWMISLHIAFWCTVTRSMLGWCLPSVGGAQHSSDSLVFYAT